MQIVNGSNSGVDGLCAVTCTAGCMGVCELAGGNDNWGATAVSAGVGIVVGLFAAGQIFG